MTVFAASVPIIPFLFAIFIGAGVTGYVLTYWIAWWKAYLIFSTSIGFCFFEIAWSRIVRYRDLDDERDSNFPAWRRMDVKNWHKVYFYLGALTIFTTKMIICLGSLAVCAGLLKVIALGHQYGTPMVGVRAVINKTVFQFWMGLIVSFCFMKVETIYH